MIILSILSSYEEAMRLYNSPHLMGGEKTHFHNSKYIKSPLSYQILKGLNSKGPKI